jgi:NADH-quinone oxidoreductase subunit J
MISSLLFILFGGLAVGCALAVVAQRNPLYSAISLIGVFVSLASLYLTLAAPFIAAVQVIVYAGAIMVLVVFVIMLLNVEEEEPRRSRMAFLVPTAVVLGAILIAEVFFMLRSVSFSPAPQTVSDVGLTRPIGIGLLTTYLLPFEITSILLLMAIVGAMTLARRTRELSAVSRVLPGAAVLAPDVIDSLDRRSGKPTQAHTVAEAQELFGVQAEHTDE